MLRAALDFEEARLKLPDSPQGQDDTDDIMEATRLYKLTWIHPIITAIELGDVDELKRLCRRRARKEILELELEAEEDYDDSEDPW